MIGVQLIEPQRGTEAMAERGAGEEEGYYKSGDGGCGVGETLFFLPLHLQAM